jgi:membrane fusion protein, multidrug efflux system
LLLMMATILVVAAAGWWLAPRISETATAAQQQSKGEASAPQGSRPVVPVLAAAAEATDMPIVVRGVGSVQAFNTVTVKSRVDGNIVKVAFTEGQYVHQGDLLMQRSSASCRSPSALAPGRGYANRWVSESSAGSWCRRC